MNVLYPHPRRALLAAAAALVLTLLALLPAMLGGVTVDVGGPDRAAPAQLPAATGGEPGWSKNPFAYPLLQSPRP